jgi:ubiquinone/menaquinone biosynthesis C-methylase UbiE
MLSISDWHNRYEQQARWTAPVRRFLYQKAGISEMARILETGCGTGAILSDLASQTRASLVGIDLLLDPLKFASDHHPGRASLANADGLHLPFENGAFDACICHYFLLWLPDPLAALMEMVRIVCRGGAILAIAEPDYGGRIDHPAELSEIGQAQSQALRLQGADPLMGRKLRGFFHQAGCSQVTSGLLGGEWSGSPTDPEWQAEWQVLAEDLTGKVSTQKLNALKALDKSAWQSGERILFVPTFYASGKV